MAFLTSARDSKTDLLENLESYRDSNTTFGFLESVRDSNTGLIFELDSVRDNHTDMVGIIFSSYFDGSWES